MQIIIVEDEMEILKGIHNMITNLDERIDGVFACNNAEEALAIIEERRPEIIITDILLPQMTGLDMLEKIREFPYSAKMMMISSYNNFSYAQKSIQLGAIDYILKPFDREQFRQKVLEVIDLVDKEHKEQNDAQKQLGFAKLGSRVLRDKFILGFCLNPTLLQEHVYHQLLVWDLKWLTEESYAAICLQKARAADKSDKQQELEHFAIGNIAEETLADYQPSVIFRSAHHRWTILTAYDDLPELIDAIRANITQYQKYEVAIGVSETMNAFHAASQAYDQSVQACKLAAMNNGNGVLFYSSETVLQHNPEHDDEILVATLLNGNPQEMSIVIESVLNRFALSREINNSREMTNKCFHWLMNGYTKLNERCGHKLSFSPTALWDSMEQCTTIEELKAFLRMSFVEIAGQCGHSAHKSEHFIIEKAKKRILESFAETISLQSIAEELDIHPVWLSQLFKKETGQNFLDFVTELRIDKAKTLLRESNDKIYEIALSVGYADLQYFGKVFKKRTGITPKEYRYGR